MKGWNEYKTNKNKINVTLLKWEHENVKLKK